MKRAVQKTDRGIASPRPDSGSDSPGGNPGVRSHRRFLPGNIEGGHPANAVFRSPFPRTVKNEGRLPAPFPIKN